ncbi:hypothetical protein [Labilibacter marinus]|nr:hypothetical protein [Labilibacter marinus]
MKRLLTLCVLLMAIYNPNYAQEASVEKSMYGVQMGINPLAVYNE